MGSAVERRHENFRDRYGPVALVTGASSGIGAAFAEVLAERGIDLVLVARRRNLLEKLADRLSDAYDIRPLICQVDLSHPDAPRHLLEATADLDIGLVVSNAGFGLKGEHSANDAQSMTDMLMVNCHMPMLLSHGFVPRLRARGKGGIILTSSIEALMGCPYSAAYSATKAMVSALGEALWAELHPENIDVLTVCPGATESEAASKQGMDLSSMKMVMKAHDVARLTLDNLRNGPTYFSSQHYKAAMDRLLALPRQDALAAMAREMKQKVA